MTRYGLARALATSGGLGEVLPAPGTTAGSAPAAAVWLLVALVAPGWTGVLGAVGVGLACAAGLWASELEFRRRGVEDPGAVVIDEVAGQWLTLLVAWPFAEGSTAPGLVAYTAVGFVFFRLFDILKPGPIRGLEALGGGAGIMADDLAAGVGAGIVLASLASWLVTAV